MGKGKKKGGDKGQDKPASDKPQPSSENQPKHPQPGPSGDPGVSTAQKKQQAQKVPQGGQQQALGPGGSQQQQQQQKSQQQQKPQQQERGPGGQQKAWGSGGQQQQQERGPGGQQQAWGSSGGQQQQKPPYQQRGPGGQQQQRGSGDAQQQIQRPQQQERGHGGQQQQWRSGGQQQQPTGQQQAWGSGGQQQQQERGPGGQQQAWGSSGQQQQQKPPYQQRGPGGQQQQWGSGDAQQQIQRPQQQERGHGGQKQQWGSGGQQQQQKPPYQQRGPGGQQTTDSISKDMSKLSIAQTSRKGQEGPKQSMVLRSIKSEYCIDGEKPGGGLTKFAGSDGSKHEIEANYLKLNMDKMPKEAYQYDVKFNMEKPLRFRPIAFEQLRVRVLGANRQPRGFPIAFDGMNIAFSAERIAPALLNTAHSVTFIDTDTNVEKVIEITMMEADDSLIDLSLLKNYQNTGITVKHIRSVQCLDVVLRNAPSQMSKQAGRAFYRPPSERLDIGDGFVLWYGLFQALSLGDYPMLNIDIAHKGFPEARSLVAVYDEFKYNMDSYIRNLNIIYEPPAVMNGKPRLYKANGLVEAANTQKFKDENGVEMTIAQYFKSKNYTLKYPALPCVSVGTVRRICLPLELCKIQEGQDVRKKAGPNQVRNLIRYAATSTTARKQKIMNLFNGFQYNQNEIVKGFNIALGSNFIKLIARNIPPPKIRYANSTISPQRGSWRADSCMFLKSAEMIKWAILVTDRRMYDNKVGVFGEKIKEEARRMGIKCDPNYAKITETNPRNFRSVFEKFKAEGRVIVFVIISGQGDSYSQVKKVAEIQFGILTQCIKSFTVERRCEDRSTIANIFLKVNSKLNGTNHMLQPARDIPLKQDMAVMFLGADVTHPSPDQSTIPSVVGVVGSYDPYAFQYKINWRLQNPREEMIQDMEGIMYDQLQNFSQKRGKLPTNIIYYRDGVSNGQFQDLQRIELNAMNKACAKFANYKPNITCLVVQKRHHTRFFPASPGIVNPRDKNVNVIPGTVVDTTITHPGQKQFFLVSHESIQGTAKPTKYCIIRDDANFSADELQALTYSLCHLFTRCNRSVSYPAPAYYAHHVAARGRVYIEGDRINLENLAAEYNNRNVDAIIRSNPMFFV